jgi:phosphotransferase system enzyme I (PtsI)
VGRIIVEPSENELSTFREAIRSSGARRERIQDLAGRPTRTADGERVVLQANLDQPHDVDQARRVGAEGVGLFRSEFLVIGRRAVPSEEDQYDAYRRVVRAFPDAEVTLRTFDIGGDKFPIFLQAPPEENPFLGWRAIRVCLERPELFRRQLRAALRAGREGRMRLLLPFVVSVSEVRRTREILRDVREGLDGDAGEVPLGVMVETPAAAATVDLLAPHVDFMSLGTNDLTQYTLAADRGNAKLSELFDPLHPALLRSYRTVLDAAEEAACEVSVCGELASDPVGVAVLLGLGYRKFSLSPSTFPEIKELVLALDTGELRRITASLHEVEEADEVRAPVERYVESLWTSAPPPTTRLSRA